MYVHIEECLLVSIKLGLKRKKNQLVCLINMLSFVTVQDLLTQ